MNASVITASQNATLSNQGFCEGDKIEQPFSQEDVEYGIFLEPYNTGFFWTFRKKLRAKKLKTQGKNSKLKLKAQKVGTFLELSDIFV